MYCMFLIIYANKKNTGKYPGRGTLHWKYSTQSAVKSCTTSDRRRKKEFLDSLVILHNYPTGNPKWINRCSWPHTSAYLCEPAICATWHFSTIQLGWVPVWVRNPILSLQIFCAMHRNKLLTVNVLGLVRKKSISFFGGMNEQTKSLILFDESFWQVIVL